MKVSRMRVDLDPRSPGAPSWPAGLDVRTFTPEDARSLHSLIEHGYRAGGGSVAAFDAWFAGMTGDAEYDPALWFLAEHRSEPVGAVVCWSSGFVKDLVVRESWRGRGLGEALMRHALGAFLARGLTAVELKVHADNERAVSLYERLGFRTVETLDAN
jgi:ribosomal protein S18 acetylase RimI-like enzyme